MMFAKGALLALAAVGLSASSTLANSFQVIGADYQFQANGLSADGSTLVGAGLVLPLGTFRLAMSWTASTGLNYLPTAANVVNSGASAASANGSVLVGSNADANDVGTAWRYTAAGGYQFVAPANATRSSAIGVSADGNTVLGTAVLGSATANTAYVWTPSGITLIPATLGDGPLLSADGKTVVGESGATSSFTDGFSWTAADGVQLWSTPNASNVQPTVVSVDGSRVYGQATYAGTNQFFLFEYTNGQLTPLPSPTFLNPETSGLALAGASANDSVRVGTQIGFDATTNLPDAVSWVYTADDGFNTLSDYLSAAGVDVGTETDLHVEGISADGTTLYGSGLVDGMQPSAWIAVVPEPGTAALSLAASTLLLRRRRSHPRPAVAAAPHGRTRL